MKFYFWLVAGAVIAVSLGCYAASEVITSQNGYVAGFIFVPLIILIGIAALLLLLAGAIICAVRGRSGIPLVISAFLLPGSFFIILMLASHYQWGAYREDPMVPLIPEVSNIVLFKKGTTEEQISSFWNETLATRREDGRGHTNIPGVHGVGRMFPRDGHEVVEFSFHASATDEQKKYAYDRVRSLPIVFELRENVPTKNYLPSEVLKSESPDNRPTKTPYNGANH